MIHQDTIIVTAVLIGFGILEALTGVYANSKRRKDDWIIDIVSVLQLAVLIKPSIIILAGLMAGYFFPNFSNSLNHLPIWIGILIIFIPDEFLHYWYHRKGHEWT